MGKNRDGEYFALLVNNIEVVGFAEDMEPDRVIVSA